MADPKNIKRLGGGSGGLSFQQLQQIAKNEKANKNRKSNERLVFFISNKLHMLTIHNNNHVSSLSLSKSYKLKLYFVIITARHNTLVEKTDFTTLNKEKDRK